MASRFHRNAVRYLRYHDAVMNSQHDRFLSSLSTFHMEKKEEEEEKGGFGREMHGAKRSEANVR